MVIDCVLDWFRGWLFVLSGIWGFILIPFAVAFIYDERKKKVGAVLAAFVAMFTILFVHDAVTYLHNKRPVVPFYEWVFTLFAPHSDSQTMLLDIPLSNCMTNISHYWRGDYGVTIWVPDRIWDLSDEDHTRLSIGIRLRGSFRRTNMQSVYFISNTNQCKKGEWSPKGGGSTIHYEYNVPSDLPLDETLAAEITVLGNLQEFRSRFPDARIRIEKLCVK